MLYDQPIQIQRLNCGWCDEVACDVLRLDQLHPVVSGNKWFKLKRYLETAKASGHQHIATFGGAWSNHLVATAFACREAGLECMGVVRGEQPKEWSVALKDAAAYGMKLEFVSRDIYRDKATLKKSIGDNYFWIDEGGYGQPGMLGAAEIMDRVSLTGYSHIICACGTGTTLAGLVLAADREQVCIGISVLKGHTGLVEAVTRLLPANEQKRDFVVNHDYHFGGYAKHPPELVEWMNQLWRESRLPTDIVYTSKMVYGVKDLVEQNYFTPKDKLLVIHSGGLQGNRSLPAGTLEF